MSSGQLVRTNGSNPMILQLFECSASDSANFSEGLAMTCLNPIF